jgi:hypothetical protein
MPMACPVSIYLNTFWEPYNEINKNVLGRSFCQVFIMRFIWWLSFFTYLPTLRVGLQKGKQTLF